MTQVKENGFYGWPYSYYGQHVDSRVGPVRPGLASGAIKPDYALGAHTASLGLTFYGAELFPTSYRGGAFIGQHGSWNRRPYNGYQVVFVPFANGRLAGAASDFLTGFLSDDHKAYGCPVGLPLTSRVRCWVDDDVGKTVRRVTPRHQ